MKRSKSLRELFRLFLKVRYHTSPLRRSIIHKDLIQALEAYTTALTLAPESPFAMVNFGDFLLFTEQREQGKAYLKKVIQSDTSGIYAKLAQDLLEAYHETL